MEGIFHSIFNALNNKNNQNLKIQSIGKYILSVDESLSYVFMNFDSNLKRNFLSFMLDNE